MRLARQYFDSVGNTTTRQQLNFLLWIIFVVSIANSRDNAQSPSNLPILSYHHLFSDSSPTWLEIQWLNYTGSDPLAVCNDGTPSAYYFKEYTDYSSRDYWLFHLPGGGQCYNEETCATRDETLISSNFFPDTLALSGIFDSNLNYSTLAHANKVYVGETVRRGTINSEANA